MATTGLYKQTWACVDCAPRGPLPSLALCIVNPARLHAAAPVPVSKTLHEQPGPQPHAHQPRGHGFRILLLGALSVSTYGKPEK